MKLTKIDKAMRPEKRKLYFHLLDEYLSENGINFEKHNMDKVDILEFSEFCLKYVRKETADLIILNTISILLEQI